MGRGILMPGGRPKIPDAELDDWRRVYPAGGAAAVQALYPHRSRKCINVVARKRGIKIADLAAFKAKLAAVARLAAGRNNWRLGEDRLMHLIYGTMPIDELMGHFPGRTKHAVRMRAVTLDIAKPHAPACRAKWAAERESV
jgi:hypothetical protein